jgi:hypothetical protein
MDGMDDTVSTAEKRFWSEFDTAIAADRNPTAAKISEITRDTIGHDVSEGTIKGWLPCKGNSPRRLPRFEDDLLAVIKALSAEQQCDWRALLRTAKKGRDARTSGDVQAVEPDPAAEERQPVDLSGDKSKTTRRDKKQRFLVLAGAAIVAAALGIVALVRTTRATDSDLPAAMPQNQEQQAASPQLCADVVNSVAHVFPKPGADPYNKIAKYKGDQMVLYPDMPDATGPDGRRYRAIRSPARADPGKSSYSWVLAGDVANAPCNAPRRQPR